MYDTWKSPETLAIISKIAGIELVTEMDFEIGHVNISVKSEDQKREELQDYAEKTQFEEDEGIAGCPVRPSTLQRPDRVGRFAG